MKTGSELISEERKRQIEKEGWTEEHDSGHQGDEILHAAICYAVNVADPYNPISTTYSTSFSMTWPWADKGWKPTKGDTVRDLVKAGALIAAEIDRRIKWKIK